MAKKFVGSPYKIAQLLIERIKRKLSRFQPNDRRFREALLRAAEIIEAHAQLNIRAKLNKNSHGPLRNSIGHRFKSNTEILVGSFGIPYARIHEYGGPITPKVARMLAIPIDPQFEGRRAKNVPNLFRGRGRAGHILFQKQADGSMLPAYVLKDSVQIPARPWLGPAVLKTRARVNEILTDVVRDKLGSD